MKKKGNRKRKKKRNPFGSVTILTGGGPCPGPRSVTPVLPSSPVFLATLSEPDQCRGGTRKLEMPQELVRFAIGLRNGNRDAKHNRLNRERLNKITDTSTALELPEHSCLSLVVHGQSAIRYSSAGS